MNPGSARMLWAAGEGGSIPVVYAFPVLVSLG
jgi:hypothetical protein